MAHKHSSSPRREARSLLALALLLSCVVISRAQAPTAFTYQGRLTDAGAPANGKIRDLNGNLLQAGCGTDIAHRFELEVSVAGQCRQAFYRHSRPRSGHGLAQM